MLATSLTWDRAREICQKLEAKIKQLQADKAPKFCVQAIQNALETAEIEEARLRAASAPLAQPLAQESDLWASGEPGPEDDQETDAEIERYFNRAGEA